MKKTMLCFAVLASMVALALSPTAVRAAYPEKPITIIVPFSAGGSADLAARLIGKRLEDELGKPVVVENLVGGAGWVGWTKLTQAKPDGYTIAVFSLAYVPGYLNPANKRTMNLSNVTPLVNQTWDVTAWAVKPDSAFKDVKQLMAYVKENPGKIKVASSITFSQHHIILLELAQRGYKMNPVHTSGVADSLAMVIGGHIDIASVGIGDVHRQMKDNALRPLVVMDTERSPTLPDTPTFLEATGLEITGFAARGFAGPANMDPEAVKRLNEAFKKILENEEFLGEMGRMDIELKYMNSVDYQAFLKKEEGRYKEILGW